MGNVLLGHMLSTSERSSVLGLKTANAPSNTAKTSSAPQPSNPETEYASNFPPLKPAKELVKSPQMINATHEPAPKESVKYTYAPTLTLPQEPLGNSHEHNCQHVTRTLCTALRANVAKVPASSRKNRLQSGLVLESAILCSTSPHA
ncbi:hypothetical protein HPB50_021847 [Hyalomma asiaticum]|uniref:Uncharacterized protein n=1 Tax=Hyalomma asiaticum TaxID=266040 RepID=A0ACB7TNF4_HYAAI|nr:hypothetical protein HPB50_021847 [Hyalomma asiaticum]